MHIQVNTGHNIHAREALTDKIDGMVNGALSRFSSHITRVNVHLSDGNGNRKSGHDFMRCMIEAHPEGRQPIAVTHEAASLDKAVEGALKKLGGMIMTMHGRLRSRGRHWDAPEEPDLSDPEDEDESFAAPL